MLSQQVLEGNLDAFSGLNARYEAPLYRFVSRHVKDNDQIHDIVQQVFFKLYVSLPLLRTDTSFKSWLFKVAHHYCIDYLRHWKRNPTATFSQLETLTDDDELSVVALLPDSNPLPDEVVEYQELQYHLYAAINRLPSHYRSIIVLHFFGQYSFGEISRILKMPENTVRTYFNRAKRLLREALVAHPLLVPC